MKRKRHSAEFKAKVVVEAMQGLRTIHEIAAEHGVHPNEISQWKKPLDSLPEAFARGRAGQKREGQPSASFAYAALAIGVSQDTLTLRLLHDLADSFDRIGR